MPNQYKAEQGEGSTGPESGCRNREMKQQNEDTGRPKRPRSRLKVSRIRIFGLKGLFGQLLRKGAHGRVANMRISFGKAAFLIQKAKHALNRISGEQRSHDAGKPAQVPAR